MKIYPSPGWSYVIKSMEQFFIDLGLVDLLSCFIKTQRYFLIFLNNWVNLKVLLVRQSTGKTPNVITQDAWCWSPK